ncbi:MAG TPA: exonuclease domain-containing protein [Longimicrobiales bacterium]|nr:exonuclease domain-containing protein [Longimicrobiales bacterium]
MTGGPPGSLVRRAAARLRAGPVHTLELARDVLGLSGHPGAASAAVFHLLGSDSRFRVDRDGVWSMDASVAPLGRPLAEVGFAVVDVETTGGGGVERGHRITDIAVVEVRGGSVVDEWQTLVNPGRRIPPAVTALTGITDGMVSGAPWFEDVAEEVVRRLEGRVFVAHNAAFDWAFVSGELLRTAGEAPDPVRLCTIRMVRRLVPELRHRNLDVVSRHFGVDVAGRHRAYGDALATARVLLRLLDEAAGRGLDDLAALDAYLRGARRRARDRGQASLPLRKRPSDPGGQP